MIAVLFADPKGVYACRSDVDLWDESRDARLYPGPWPVVAHPPCQRWGRFWPGCPGRNQGFKLGDDGGCFDSAISAVRRFGGVLEHPAATRAWAAYGLAYPPLAGGWVSAGDPAWEPCDCEEWWCNIHGCHAFECDCPPVEEWPTSPYAPMAMGWVCHVEQGNYGHFSPKPTWLYAVTPSPPPALIWGPSGKEGRIEKIWSRDPRRWQTPAPFAELLLSIARSCSPELQGRGFQCP